MHLREGVGQDCKDTNRISGKVEERQPQGNTIEDPSIALSKSKLLRRYSRAQSYLLACSHGGSYFAACPTCW